MRRSSRQSAVKANETLMTHEKSKKADVEAAAPGKGQDVKPGIEAVPEVVTSSSFTVAGRKRKTAADPTPAPVVEEPAPKAKKTRAKSKKVATADVEMAEASPADDAHVETTKMQEAGAAAADPSEAPPPPAAEVKGKGKEMDVGADDEKLPPWADNESETSWKEPKKPAKKAKKTVKKLEKKISNWKELLVPSKVSFRSFPAELMSEIVSVDSDLELRDHLALAATCRFFRSCYTDVVWQVLFQANFPHIIGDISEIFVDYTAERQRDTFTYATVKADPTLVTSYVSGPALNNPYRWDSKHGPYSRSWFAGRQIFTSGTEGAPGAVRWGQSKAEWDAGTPERQALADATRDAVIASMGDKAPAKYSYDGRMELCPGVYAQPIFRELTDTEKLYYPQVARHVEQRVEREAVAKKDDAFDAWPSAWRDLVAKIVNKPLVTKTDAKKYFKLQDRELLCIPLVKRIKEGPGRYDTYGIPAHGGYRLAQLQCLSLRSHGGVKGHEEHVKKLDARAKKAEATRIRNGTNKRKRVLPPAGAVSLSMLQAFMLDMMDGGYDDEYYDDYYDNYYDNYYDGEYDSLGYDSEFSDGGYPPFF